MVALPSIPALLVAVDPATLPSSTAGFPRTVDLVGFLGRWIRRLQVLRAWIDGGEPRSGGSNGNESLAATGRQRQSSSHRRRRGRATDGKARARRSSSVGGTQAAAGRGRAVDPAAGHHRGELVHGIG
ncbi:hypothetical protein E2562_034545 [Oryza meyeriana var. granulata]|uniref:Uncharacterized protein n=1 Tax=Oryza meyeriana var. granulata TaxID=110450 RepID=A0A6G1ECJ4_9ORYZ|nr:hypothetical protein E2562_034545 [Oryza meyeriana var. granulata]